MTQLQYNATLRTLVREWKQEYWSKYDADIEAMYRSRCEASGIDYDEFLTKRERKAKPYAYKARW